MKKYLILIFVCYFFVLLQTTFLVHFSLFGLIPNLVLLLVFIWNLFESQKAFSGFFIAIIGGFFLDIFSSNIIGVWILVCLALAVFIKIF